MLSSASSSSSSGRRPYYTGKRYNPDGTRRKKHGAPGIGTWCLAVLLGCIIVIVLKANGDDDAKTILRRDDSDVWVEIHPDLSEKTPCTESCTRVFIRTRKSEGRSNGSSVGNTATDTRTWRWQQFWRMGPYWLHFKRARKEKGNRTNTSRSHTEREKRRIRLVLVKSRERRPPKEGVPGRAS